MFRVYSRGKGAGSSLLLFSIRYSPLITLPLPLRSCSQLAVGQPHAADGVPGKGYEAATRGYARVGSKPALIPSRALAQLLTLALKERLRGRQNLRRHSCFHL